MLHSFIMPSSTSDPLPAINISEPTWTICGAGCFSGGSKSGRKEATYESGPQQEKQKKN